MYRFIIRFGALSLWMMLITASAFPSLVVAVEVDSSFSHGLPFDTHILKQDSIPFAVDQVIARSLWGRNAFQSQPDKLKESQKYVESHNASFVLERVQLGGANKDGPWMYTKGDDPFTYREDSTVPVHAFTRIGWNPSGKGNRSCSSGGSGRQSRGYLDPFHYYLELDRPKNFHLVQAVINNLELANFTHINTADNEAPWNSTGQAGDRRRYVNGSFDVFDDKRLLLSVRNLEWLQNFSYPYPAGNPSPDSDFISAYFVGVIREYGSDDKWVRAIDPFGTGYVLGVVTAAAYGANACYSAASFWVTVRGFPDFAEGTEESIVVQNNTSNLGAKVGRYYGSKEAAVLQARRLGGASARVVSTAVATIVAGTVVITAVAVVFPTVGAVSVVMPGNGASRLIKNAAFVAKLSEIRGFHTDAMREYGNTMKPFLAKFRFPFSSPDGSSTLERWVWSWSLRSSWAAAVTDGEDEEGGNIDVIVSERQGEEESDASVSDDIFGGCSFYTSFIVFGFLGMHFMIWLFTRKKPMAEQIAPHAWMVYLLSVVMSYVYTASVLNSFQYLRSHVGRGTGKAKLFTVAVLQLLFVDVAFLLFFLIVTLVAVRRLRLRNVKWIPRDMHPDPAVRRSFVVAGEYEAEDDNVFHSVFESYYSGLAGPRVWLAALEMLVTFLDAMVTAVIWNEVVCLAVLVALHSLLFTLFVMLGPFVDRIEGRLVLTVGFLDLSLLFLEFLTAMGSYATAERMESLVIVMATISVGVATALTVYCDVIPISLTVWEWLRERVWSCLRRAHLVEEVEQDDWSQWSALSKGRAPRGGSGDGSGGGSVGGSGDGGSGGGDGGGGSGNGSDRKSATAPDLEEGRGMEERLRGMGLRLSARGGAHDGGRGRRLWRGRKRVERWVRPNQEEDGGQLVHASAHTVHGGGHGGGRGGRFADGDRYDHARSSGDGEEDREWGLGWEESPMAVAEHEEDEASEAERPQWSRSNQIENVWDMQFSK